LSNGRPSHRLTLPCSSLQVTVRQSWTPSSRPSASWLSIYLLNLTELLFYFLHIWLFIKCLFFLTTVHGLLNHPYRFHMSFINVANPVGCWMIAIKYFL
jgi:hypothetical protein